MYYLLYIFLLLSSQFLLSTYYYPEQQSLQQPISNVQISPVFNPEFTNNPNYTIENRPEIHCTLTTINHLIGMKIYAFTVNSLQALKDTLSQNNYEQLKILIKKNLWNYKYRIVLFSLLGSYVGINSVLINDYMFITNKALWANWKSELSFADLCSVPQKELEKELIRTITQRNYNKNNPTDFSFSMVTFINTIDKEIMHINRYIKNALLLKKYGLARFFFFNDLKINQANQLLERAHFIKHVFISWLSEYNLGNF